MYLTHMPKVLIIEDSEDLREMMTLILKNYRHEVVAASEKIEVDLILSDFKPDVVLIDVWLKNTSGRELCSQIKTIRSGTPVILMSANPKLLDDYKSCEANDILEKPFEIKTLLGKIDSALNNSYTAHQHRG